MCVLFGKKNFQRENELSWGLACDLSIFLGAAFFCLHHFTFVWGITAAFWVGKYSAIAWVEENIRDFKNKPNIVH